MRENLLEPVKYRYLPHEKVEVFIENTGKAWAIRMDGYVLNCDGDWEHEPQPSSRTEEFLIRCRFETPDEAVACLQKHGY